MAIKPLNVDYGIFNHKVKHNGNQMHGTSYQLYIRLHVRAFVCLVSNAIFDQIYFLFMLNIAHYYSFKAISALPSFFCVSFFHCFDALCKALLCKDHIWYGMGHFKIYFCYQPTWHQMIMCSDFTTPFPSTNQSYWFTFNEFPKFETTANRDA